MTTEYIKSANTVLKDFLDEQAKNEYLNAACVSAIISLRENGKLTKTNLLRQLEEARKAELRDDTAAGD